MRRFPISPHSGVSRGWISLVAMCFIYVTGVFDLQRADAATPVFAQISGVPTNPGGAATGGSDPTFQRAAMVAVCLLGIFLLSLLCYLVLFSALLQSFWPRTAYAIISAVFWVLSTALVLGLFWQSLKYRFTQGEAWYNENGVRALIIAQAIVVACLFLFTMRSEGPFPVLVKDRPAKPK